MEIKTKFNIGDKVYVLSIRCSDYLIKEVFIVGITYNERDGIFYSISDEKNGRIQSNRHEDETFYTEEEAEKEANNVIEKAMIETIKESIEDLNTRLKELSLNEKYEVILKTQDFEDKENKQ